MKYTYFLVSSLFFTPATFTFPCGESTVPEQKIIYSLPVIHINRALKESCGSKLKELPGGTSTTNLSLLVKNSSWSSRTKCADLLASSILSSFNKNAISLTLTPRTSKIDYDFDLIIIGAGVHSAVLARNLSLGNPNLKILIIDKNEIPAEHFRTYIFRMNSPGLPVDTNALPASPLAISDYVKPEDPEAFPIARHFWNLIMFNTFASNALVSLKTEVKSMNKEQEGYLVELKGRGLFSDSRKILVKKIVFSTGLGTEIIPNTDDKKWLEKQLNYRASKASIPAIPRVMTFEGLFALHDRLRSKGDSIFNFLMGQRVAVIGGGDGSKITVEFLTGFSPSKAYENPLGGPSLYHPLATLIWAGQKNDSYEKFIDPTSGTMPRYKNAAFASIYVQEDSQKTSITFIPKPDKVAKINPNMNYLDIHYDGNIIPEQVDYVVSAVGYQSMVDELLLNKTDFVKNRLGNEKVPFKRIYAPVENLGNLKPSIEPVAGQLCFTDYICEQIFLVGTAGREELTVSEERMKQSITKNPVAIEILAPLTAAFSRILF
jgi:hypothetical protein